MPPKRARSGGVYPPPFPQPDITLLAVMLVATFLFPFIVITVPSGSVGVLWKRFNGYDLYCWCFVGRGTILDPRELRDEGLHVIWPWDKLFLYDLRLQSSTQTYNAISKDGVMLTRKSMCGISCCTITLPCCTSSSDRNTCIRSWTRRSEAARVK